MTDLVEFLRARLDEDGAAAKAATEPFLWGDRTGMKGLHPQILRYVYRYTPSRTLPDIEAKRRIVEWMLADRAWSEDPDCPDGQRLMYKLHAGGLFDALSCLALPYADHPDYRQEWAPDT